MLFPLPRDYDEVTSQLGMTLDVRDDAAKSAKILAMSDEIERACHLLHKYTETKNTLRHTLPQFYNVNVSVDVV